MHITLYISYNISLIIYIIYIIYILDITYYLCYIYIYICIRHQECIPVTISYHSYFLRISKVWGMLHHGSVGRVQSEECYFMFPCTFLAFFCCFSSKILMKY